MRHLAYLIVFFIIQTAPGQDIVREIFIQGNEKTSDQVIRRELLFGNGQTVSDSLLEYSRKRVENLLLFNRVEFIKMPGENYFDLLILVSEQMYLFPYPTITREDRDWNKLTYGFGLAHTNFRGQNEKVFVSMYFGYRPGFQFQYFNPWIHRKLHFTTGLYARNYSTQNRTYLFEEKHQGYEIQIGKYWTRHLFSSVAPVFEQVNVAKENSGFLQSGKSSENLFSIKLISFYDTRDLVAYPSTGWYVITAFWQNGISSKQIDFREWHFDVRKYFRVGPTSLGVRYYNLLTAGQLPVYRRVYFGYGERIRGHFYDTDEGTQAMSAGLEWRFPLLPVRYLNLNTTLLPPEISKNLKFGLNWALFAESGTVWSHKSGFSTGNFISGFGAGLHFRVPYLEVVRLDLAFDEKWHNQYIFETQLSL